MFGYLSKSISQLGDPALRRVALIGICGSAVIFVLLNLLIWWLFASQVDLVALNLWGWLENALNWMAGFVIGFSLLVVSTILFPGVSTIIVGFFLEDVVIAVEAKHYPNKPPARAQPVSEVVASTAKFALAVVGLNLVCLPIYLILMFVPPLNLVLYYLLNGYLISREYFELVSSRRIDAMSVLSMRRQNRGRILLSGILLTFILSVPIINFLTPVIATAFMVHVFHSLPSPKKIPPA
ncbi:MAG: EI24 domain-containing protein [Pseudomonadota bacterium]|nr:EI24 domain-containing protein [Pseudomonadota bacterium]